MIVKEGSVVDSLISEYSNLIGNVVPENIQSQSFRSNIIRKLKNSASWTSSGTNEILSLVDNYGAFMLRNALALAVALNKEDGDLNL
jgi:hypothetical protein